jgi:hypothetical protein
MEGESLIVTIQNYSSVSETRTHSSRTSPLTYPLGEERCDELHCPGLALKVFGDYSKYNLTLTQAGARQLLFSLHSRYPISDTMTATALWTVYNLPPIFSDPVSCAILAAACLKEDDTPQSRVVGLAMLGRLKEMIGQAEKLPPKELNDLPRIWLEKALGKIDRMIDKAENADQLQWVRDWRADNGFNREPTLN